MKTSNKKKIVVSTLALAMGAALAGSISGSVAWYQYSTRATASLSGTSAGTSRNLKITTDAAAAADKTDSDWGWDVNLGKHDLKPVAPVMSAATNVLPSSFKSHGVRQYAELAAANPLDAYSFDLYFQSLKEGGAREAVQVYLETFDVDFGSSDLEEALRIAISDGTTTWLLSKTAGNTKTEGQLDLNKDGANDRWIFEADDRTGLAQDTEDENKWKYVSSVVAVTTTPGAGEIAVGTDVTSYYTTAACTAHATGTAVEGTTYYSLGAEPGESKTNVSHANDGDYIIYHSGSTVTEYTTTSWDTGLVSSFTNEYTVVEGAQHFKFSTLEAEDAAAHLQVKMWLDGFAKIGDPASNIWDSTLIGDDFSIKMRFQTIAVK